MTQELRNRAQMALRTELANAAVDHIVLYGYEHSTAEELARALGISRASFFRYLGSKDRAIVWAMLGPDDQFAKALRNTEPQSDQAQWQRLRQAFEPAARLASQHPKRQRQRLRLVDSLPAVGGELRRARVPQTKQLTEALVEAGNDEFEATILATAAVAVLDRSWMIWMNDEAACLEDILDRSFEALAAASEAPLRG